MTSAARYRRDIDGLRAVAVLSVVLYHFGIGALNGGFIGVDIFFVISGFLISGIIHREIEGGTFSFSAFYERRARRIFPALFVVLLATLAAGPFILLPSDLANLGKTVVATLLFCSNILFWRQSGYFDTTSHLNPLLHTWSLAVEEQFYIVFPILLIVLNRFARRRLLAPILGLAALGAFALCIWQQPIRPGATFYLAPFRAWEFLLGSLLAIGAVPPIRRQAVREVLAAIALLVLFVAIWRIEAGIAFPGWYAAPPVLATATLLYLGGHGSTLVDRLLSARPIVFIGTISYSLYLWHWPVLVYARYRKGMIPLELPESLGLVTVVAVLAWLSFRFVETPFRRRGSPGFAMTRHDIFIASAVSIAGLGTVAFGMTIDRGWQSRISATATALDRQRSPDLPFALCDGILAGSDRRCTAGSLDAARRIMLWGDSHALAWSPAFDLIGKRADVAVDLAVASACPPLIGVANPFNAACRTFNARTIDQIRRERPDQVYLVASWPAYSRPEGEYALDDDTGRRGNAAVFAPALRRTIDALRPLTRRIVLIDRVPGAVGDVHFGGDVPFKLALSAWHGTPPIPEKALAAADHETRWYRAAVAMYRHDPQVVLVTPAAWFCDSRSCRYRNDGGDLLYRDTNHLSKAGAEFVAGRFPAALLAARPAAASSINEIHVLKRQ